MKYYVYILSSKTKVLYIGVTGNFEKRINEHKLCVHKGFSQKYKCDQLVYFEEYTDPKQAIQREKQLKKYSRNKKEELIVKFNSEWKDLSES